MKVQVFNVLLGFSHSFNDRFSSFTGCQRAIISPNPIIAKIVAIIVVIPHKYAPNTKICPIYVYIEVNVRNILWLSVNSV